MSGPVRYDITFTGRVQGVFFRATTREAASSFDVTGWVRNEPDGSVRCVVEGEPLELDQFIETVRRAKAANILDVLVERADATGEFGGFEVRRR